MEQRPLFQLVATVDAPRERHERQVHAFLDRRSGERRRQAADKLVCPHCGGFQSVVLPHAQTVQEQLTHGHWRRRACLDCRKVFATEEKVSTATSSEHP